MALLGAPWRSRPPDTQFPARWLRLPGGAMTKVDPIRECAGTHDALPCSMFGAVARNRCSSRSAARPVSGGGFLALLAYQSFDGTSRRGDVLPVHPLLGLAGSIAVVAGMLRPAFIAALVHEGAHHIHTARDLVSRLTGRRISAGHRQLRPRLWPSTTCRWPGEPTAAHSQTAWLLPPSHFCPDLPQSG